tara:strand:+ start:14646 stop:15212 length:567 start_codon:yes stop_codon:yes gene_type:complete
MIVIIDNFDSFTYNIVQLLGDMGYDSMVHRNNEVSLAEIKKNASHLIISPGPCTPSKAGISVSAVQEFCGKIPVLGVCLGHQSIAEAYGASIIKSPKPMHGKVDKIINQGNALFKDVPETFEATRYHSLIVEERSLSSQFSITARALSDNNIMSIAHINNPTFGVQFHPESIASEFGSTILRNFLNFR